MQNLALLIFPAIVLWFGCENPAGTSPVWIAYSNSFETGADTVGWGPLKLAGDVPPDGGRNSVWVPGGESALMPGFKIGGEPLCGYYVIRCWGKSLGSVGEVELGIQTNSVDSASGVEVILADSAWTSYQSSRALWCPSGSSLQIQVRTMGGSGGFLFDRIEVAKVE